MRFLLILLTLISGASARIGDTYEELVARLGKPITEPKKSNWSGFDTISSAHKLDALEVEAYLVDGKVVRMSYKGVTEGEVPKLLAQHLDAAKWKLQNRDGNALLWLVPDTKWKALYGRADKYLSVQSPAYSDFQEEISKRFEKANPEQDRK